MSVQIFLSTVTDEFRVYREELRGDLTRPNVEVRVQEDFKDLGGSTLDKLDVYIAGCDAVVHLVGDMTGSTPGAHEQQELLAKYPDLPERLPPLGEALRDRAAIPYTQWEAWLALYHRKPLLIAKAAQVAPRGPKHNPTDDSKAAQAAHLARLRAFHRFPACEFVSEADLAKHVAYTSILDLLAQARAEGRQYQPRNLPYASLGTLFKGREDFLERLHAALTGGSGQAAVTGKALHGLGGIGKTRLAIEYAWQYAQDYSALLFISAETSERLMAGLAALSGADSLDLPEKETKEDAAKIAAALHWLSTHPTWLLILDNVDDAKAAAAVDMLLPRLSGGHVLITGRTGDFSASVVTLPLDSLNIDDSVDFLLERTDGKRTKAPTDEALARELGLELGGLALGLEQAGAYIAKQRIGFARYLTLWRESREKVLSWFDPHLMSYNHDVGLAATWLSSVQNLSPSSRQLLELCAFLAPEPIPDFLLEMEVPGAPAGYDPAQARSELLSYAFAMPVEAEGAGRPAGFALHRLVQDFTQRQMAAEQHQTTLQQALIWVDAAFVVNPQDVRTWPRLDPLAPHALVLTKQADAADIPEPTARFMNQLGKLFQAKAQHAEAEPLYRRALAICEAIYGADHPNTAVCLNSLGGVLRATNRFAEAEPLYLRALGIDEASYEPDHAKIAMRLNNLAGLLYAMDRLAEAEPLYRRALTITEASYGPDHVNVATNMNNLALVLKSTNRPAEAEPLYRRSLAITEANYGSNHPAVAIRLNNLAGLLHATNRVAEAEPLFRRALAITEVSYGPDHPDVAIDLNNLAILLINTNRLAEAEPLSRRHLEIFFAFTANTGHSHPHLRAAYSNYSDLLIAMGRSTAEAHAEIDALANKHGLSFEVETNDQL